MSPGRVLFFDGVCNLCNASIQFIIRHDKSARIQFAPLQSNAGRAALEAVFAASGRRPDSLVFLDGEKYFTESDAALRVARYLDGSWKALYALRIFPLFLRNAVYRAVARTRYRWAGRRAECMIPTPGLRSRFIE